MISGRKILIIGVFSKKGRPVAYVTASEQLADLFEKNNIGVIRTAYSPNRIIRLLQIVGTIFSRKNEFDLAIVPLYGTAPAFYLQVITSRLLKALNKKVIMVVHGGSIPGRMKKKSHRFLRSIKRANRVVTPSGFLQHELGKYDIPSTVIENVIVLRDYPFTPKKKFRPKLLWMRTFEDIYDPFMAIDVAAILAEKYDGFKMVMAGADKGLLAPAKKYAEQKGVAAKISFPGFIVHEQKINYARDFDFFISTNRVDNAPVSLVEFMALGLVVISVDVGGISHMIKDGCNGFLVAQDDAHTMANKITELIEATQAAEKITHSARVYAEQYDETVVMGKWKELLLEVSSL